MSAKHAVWVAALLVPFCLGSGWIAPVLASDEDVSSPFEAFLPEPDNGSSVFQTSPGSHADQSVAVSAMPNGLGGPEVSRQSSQSPPQEALVVVSESPGSTRTESSEPPARTLAGTVPDSPPPQEKMAIAAPHRDTSSVQDPNGETADANESGESRQQTVAAAPVAEETVPAAFPEDNPFAPGDAVVANGERETLSVSVISWRDLPFQTVRRQSFDYSCGSAALATLLTYVYDTPTAEKTVFRDMFQKGNKAKIRREGFSMMDMSNYLNRRGFKAGGYRLSFDLLQKKKVPVIALINNEGYKHFVVVKSLGGPFVLVGDPNKGNVVYTRNAFAGMWDGIALVVTNHAGKARTAFQNPKEWLYARQRIFPGEGQYPGMDDINQSFINWQVAPANTDLIEGPMRLFSSGRLP